jgi:hypothetical protein
VLESKWSKSEHARLPELRMVPLPVTFSRLESEILPRSISTVGQGLLDALTCRMPP